MTRKHWYCFHPNGAYKSAEEADVQAVKSHCEIPTKSSWYCEGLFYALGTVLRAENMAVNSKILPPLILCPSTGDETRVDSEKTSMPGKIEGKRRRGQWRMRWLGQHHRLSGHGLEQTLGDSEGQGSLEHCSPWGCKESDTTERMNNNNNRRLLKIKCKNKHIMEAQCAV